MTASLQDYIDALEKMKRSPRDRVGLLGELGAAGLGTAGGGAAAGAVAGFFGATTLAGSTTLASVLGGVFVTATPLGWAIGSAVAGGTLAYGVVRMVRSGARADAHRRLSIQQIERRLAGQREATRRAAGPDTRFDAAITALQVAVSGGLVETEKVGAIVAALAAEKLTPSDVLDYVEERAQTVGRMSKSRE